MGTGATNGRGPGLLEDEWAMSPFGLREDELSAEDELTTEDESLEDELGAHENLWATPEMGSGEAWESAGSLEGWAGELAGEWSPEALFAGSQEGGFHEAAFEDEDEAGFETLEGAFEHPEGAYEDEADPFLPFLAPLAMKALPMLARAAVPHIRRLIPVARNAVGRVVRNVTSTAIPPSIAPTARVLMQGLQTPRPRVRPVPPRPYPGPYVRPAPRPGPNPWQGGGLPFPPFPMPPVPVTPPRPVPQPPMTVGTILRRLADVLQVGDAVAQEMEASFFGSNELQPELANHELAHEAALTEVLAAEAAHATTEREAGALLGSALPITIRIMAGGREVRPLVPTLQRANARLVTSLRRSGPGGPELLRAVPTIQRRTIATIREARRSGRPVGARMVGPIMAAHAARVLGTPRTCGHTLLRNVAVRQGTVAPAGRRVVPRSR